MTRLRRHIQQTVWPRRNIIGQIEYGLLRPFSEVFGLAVGLRNLAYRVGLLRTQVAPVPVVSVGNLSVGGTGKTPLTLWLSQALRERGIRVAIVLRGYGGSATGVTVVSRGTGPEVKAEAAGDEAVMLAKCFPGPIVTSARRVDGAIAAVALGAELLVLDDAFQHRRLARQFDLVLVDGRRGPLLPAGPLREGMGALRRADAVVLVEQGEASSPFASDVLDPRAVYRMRMQPTALIEAVAGQWLARPLAQLAGRRIIVVAGIANPERFYRLLRQWDAVIAEIFEFPDHHQYSVADWKEITRRGRDADLIVTTEKDLVKLESFPFASGTLVALRIAPVLDRPHELVDAVVATTAERAAACFPRTLV